jgi:hypothetical protein
MGTAYLYNIAFSSRNPSDYYLKPKSLMNNIKQKRRWIHITEASPVDDRLIISTEQEIAILVNKEPMLSVMYDGMVVTFADSKRTFIWLESQQGLMATGYTYPEWYGMMVQAELCRKAVYLCFF